METVSKIDRLEDLTMVRVAFCAITDYDNENVHCVGDDVYKTFVFWIQKKNVGDLFLRFCYR